MTAEFIAMLGLIAVVGVVCFFSGWRSAAAYLPAARAVSEVASAAAQQANSYSASLDKLEVALQSLKNEAEASRKGSAEHNRAVEETLIQLFAGLERAGLARAPRATARQVGEAPSDS